MQRNQSSSLSLSHYKSLPFLNSDQQQKNSDFSLLLFAFIIHMLRISQSCFAWLISNNQNIANYFEPFLASFSNSILYRTLFIVIIFFKAIVITLIYLKSENSRNILLQKIISFQTKYYREYKEIDLVATAYLLSINWQENVVSFAFSVLFEGYDLVYYQNYIIRRTASYVNSYQNYLVYRIIIILMLVVNSVNIQVQIPSIYGPLWIILTISLTIWFFVINMQISTSQTINRFISAEIAIYIAIVFTILENIFFPLPIDLTSLSKHIMIVCAMVLFFEISKSKYRSNLMASTARNAKQYDLIIMSALEHQNGDVEFQLLLSGLLTFHSFQQCFNALCFTKCSEFYDPAVQKIINTRNILEQKQSLARLHIQCLYEQQRIDTNQSVSSILSYCQFLYNENGSMTRLLALLAFLQLKNLNIIERLIIERYRFLISNAFEKLNESQYEGKLKFEKIIQYQQKITLIKDKIMVYTKRNEHIWQLFSKNEVEIQLIREQFEQNLKIIKEIDSEWSTFTYYFQFNRQWKRIYYNYLIFIKNQSIKHKELEDLKGQEKVKLITTFRQIQLQSDSQKNNLMISTALFSKNVSYLKAVYIRKQVIIKKISQTFEENMGYSNEELSQCQIETILNEDLVESHKEKVISWIEKGYQTNESSYSVKVSDLRTKEGIKRPVLKMFRTCYNIEDGLQFVCLLRFQDYESTKTEAHDYSYCRIPTSQILASQHFLNSKSSSGMGSLQLKENNESNIFLKEENIDCSTKNQLIDRFQFLGRLLCSIAGIFLVISLFTLTSNNNGLVTHSNQFINFMYLYRYPIILNINYMKSFLNIGNQTKAVKAITTNTNSMAATLSNPLTLQTLFNLNINEPKKYYPDGSYFNEFNNVSYNQFDLFYTITSSIMSLSKAPINRTSLQYKQFSTFLKPSYDNMINGTKNRLHGTFKQLITSSYNLQISVLIIGTVVFIVFFALMFIQLIKFFQKRKAITSIIKDFPDIHYKTIKKYFKAVSRHFHILFQNVKEARLNATSSSLNANALKLQNLNKKEKLLSQKPSKHLNHILITKFIFFIAEIITIAMFVMMVLFNLTEINYLYQFQDAGFYFLRYFPTGPIITMGAVEKYYSVKYPLEKTFDPSKYDDVISSMELFGNFPYIGSLQSNSQYFQKQKNYFFGNPCTYNPSLLATPGVNVSTCQTISNGTFSTGISTYLRYSQRLGTSYIRGQINMTVAQLDEYVLSVNILTVYVLDAISTWITEFIQNIQSFQSYNTTIGILIISSMILVHIISNEIIVKALLNKQYFIIKQLYRFYVPNFILNEQKVVKQKFIIEGLINKQ